MRRFLTLSMMVLFLSMPSYSQTINKTGAEFQDGTTPSTLAYNENIFSLIR